MTRYKKFIHLYYLLRQWEARTKRDQNRVNRKHIETFICYSGSVNGVVQKGLNQKKKKEVQKEEKVVVEEEEVKRNSKKNQLIVKGEFLNMVYSSFYMGPKLRVRPLSILCPRKLTECLKNKQENQQGSEFVPTWQLFRNWVLFLDKTEMDQST